VGAEAFIWEAGAFARRKFAPSCLGDKQPVERDGNEPNQCVGESARKARWVRVYVSRVAGAPRVTVSTTQTVSAVAQMQPAN
jgi:hypothetical protein